MNYHSSQNTTVMSTVFKLKAAILMVCALLVINVSTAWGETATLYATITDAAGNDVISCGDIENGYVVTSNSVYISIYNARSAGLHGDNTSQYGNWKTEIQSVDNTTWGLFVNNECKFISTNKGYTNKNDLIKFGPVALNAGVNEYEMYTCNDAGTYAGVRLSWPGVQDRFKLKITYEQSSPLAIASPENGTKVANDVTSQAVTISGGSSCETFSVWITDKNGERKVADKSKTSASENVTVNVPLEVGDNIVKVIDSKGNTVSQIKINRADKVDPSDVEGTVDGFRTWEIEVCQDPDKTAAEIGPDALTFSAVAVTHGVGHWEVYPKDSNGGTIVTPSSENTKIDYLPLGETRYAWVVVNTATNINNNKEEVCDTLAIIRVKNSFIKAQLPQTIYGTCDGEVTLTAINPQTQYGTDAHGVWKFKNNDYSGKVPTIAYSDMYETAVTDLGYNTTMMTWSVFNGTNDMCHDEASVRIDNNDVDAVITGPVVTTICKPDDLELKALGQRDGVTQYWSLAQVSDDSFDKSKVTYEASNQPTTKVYGLTATAYYTFTWHVERSSYYEEGGQQKLIKKCEDEAVISIRNNAFSVDADVDDDDNHVFVCEDKYELKPTAPEGYIGKWEVTDAGNPLNFGTAADKSTGAQFATVQGLTDHEWSMTWTV